jgi:hypothetical protein
MIYSYKVFAVEIRTPGTEFENYSPDNYTVKVMLWNDTYSTSEKPIDKKSIPLRIPINKDATLIDLM